MRTALAFLLMASAAIAATTVPVQIGNETTRFLRVYHDWDDVTTNILIPPGDVGTIYFRHGGTLSNHLEAEIAETGQQVMTQDVTVGSTNSAYAYTVVETSPGTYTSQTFLSYGEANDLNDPNQYGYTVFLAGLGLAATVRLTRIGLRWVRAVGETDHGGF